MEFSLTFIIVQLIGLIIFVLCIIGTTKLETKQVFLYNAIENVLATVQYLLLGAWTGAMCCIIAVLRNVVFARYKKKVPMYVLIIYIIVVILLNFKMVHNLYDIVPIINIIIFAIALWSKDIMNIKVVGLFTCVDGGIYDFNKGAYVTVFKEIIDGIVAISAIYLIIKKSRRRT